MSFAGTLDDLPLPDHRYGLITRKRLRGETPALEAQPWPDQALDTPVILLDDVIQELHLPQFGKAPEFSLTFHGFRRNRVCSVLVHRDGAWMTVWACFSAFRNNRRAAAARLGESRKSMVCPLASTARYRYTHFPFYADICLILSANSGGLWRCQSSKAVRRGLGARPSVQPVHNPRDVHRSRHANLLETGLQQSDIAAASQAKRSHAL